jgi:hypothetical protein
MPVDPNVREIVVYGTPERASQLVATLEKEGFSVTVDGPREKRGVDGVSMETSALAVKGDFDAGVILVAYRKAIGDFRKRHRGLRVDDQDNPRLAAWTAAAFGFARCSRFCDVLVIPSVHTARTVSGGSPRRSPLHIPPVLGASSRPGASVTPSAHRQRKDRPRRFSHPAAALGEDPALSPNAGSSSR